MSDVWKIASPNVNDAVTWYKQEIVALNHLEWEAWTRAVVRKQGRFQGIKGRKEGAGILILLLALLTGISSTNAQEV